MCLSWTNKTQVGDEAGDMWGCFAKWKWRFINISAHAVLGSETIRSELVTLLMLRICFFYNLIPLYIHIHTHLFAAHTTSLNFIFLHVKPDGIFLLKVFRVKT